MKKSFKPASWIYPQPALVIVSQDKAGETDAMVAAWGGIYDTNKIGFMLDHNHKTTDNILETGAFTVSMATLKTMAEADYFGTVSGHKVKGKIEKAGFHAVKSEHVDAPVIEEFPLTFECKVVKTTQEGEDWYIVGEIVNILADESVLTGGKLDPSLIEPLTFDPVHGTYIRLGDVAAAHGEKEPNSPKNN